MIGIKGLDKMPDICQKCPCFTTYEHCDPIYDIRETIVVQYCNATKLPIKEALVYSSVIQEWFHTERPKWCPLREIKKDQNTEELDKDEWHRSIAGLSDW